MANCFEVFSTWDDEYDKLQGLMRDIVKKKRDEHLKMVWRVNFSHKRLDNNHQCHIFCLVVFSIFDIVRLDLEFTLFLFFPT
jgi:hypothetical protein